ncbi:hypothetical protein [Mycoplasma struthionis]|uniref:hypothetical protein n=1 Tax=Mycoplasma struthionis TaxID=538220 RepID=UPI0013005A4E|nr:hypothetical protein [Mycoplasma struthionis]
MTHKKVRTRKAKNYYVTKDVAFLWTLFILFNIFFIIVSFLNIPYLTTLHSFSLNVIFGMFSILIYVWFILFGFKNVMKSYKTSWQKSVYTKGVFHVSLWRIGFFFFAITLLGSTIYYLKNSKPVDYKIETVFQEVFKNWFNDFKNTDNVLLPNKLTPGLIGTLFFATSSIASYKAGIAIAFVISSIILVLSIAFFFIASKKNKVIKPADSQSNQNLVLEETKTSDIYLNNKKYNAKKNVVNFEQLENSTEVIELEKEKQKEKIIEEKPTNKKSDFSFETKDFDLTWGNEEATKESLEDVSETKETKQDYEDFEMIEDIKEEDNINEIQNQEDSLPFETNENDEKNLELDINNNKKESRNSSGSLIEDEDDLF